QTSARQFLRAWRTRESGWHRATNAPTPVLPAVVVARTRRRYVEVFHLLTGHHVPLIPLIDTARGVTSRAPATGAGAGALRREWNRHRARGGTRTRRRIRRKLSLRRRQ